MKNKNKQKVLIEVLAENQDWKYRSKITEDSPCPKGAEDSVGLTSLSSVLIHLDVHAMSKYREA